jgi:hypothetical protein
VEWISAGIGTFVAFGEGFVSAANKFLFVTNKNFKIGTADNVWIRMGLDRAREELVNDEEELLDDGEEFIADGVETLHQGIQPDRRITVRSAGSKNTFEARTCSAVSAMSGRVLKQFVVTVRFMVRLTGTAPSTTNTAGSATETQWFSGDRIVAAAVFYGQNRQ